MQESTRKNIALVIATAIYFIAVWKFGSVLREYNLCGFITLTSPESILICLYADSFVKFLVHVFGLMGAYKAFDYLILFIDYFYFVCFKKHDIQGIKKKTSYPSSTFFFKKTKAANDDKEKTARKIRRGKNNGIRKPVLLV